MLEGGIKTPTEVICALVATSGVVISAFISWLVSRASANKEIEKLMLTWEREDIVSSDDEFADMSSSVAKYIVNLYSSERADAMGKVAAIRSKESGSISEKLDNLYSALKRCDVSEIDQSLNDIIDEKRNSKGKNKTGSRNSPNRQ